jgi:imidazole glycerol-phosphate synthase subunit HisH
VLDYDAGNLRSAERALQRAGFAAAVVGDPRAAEDADLVVVPGVGHFGQCARRFEAAGFGPLVRDRAAAGRPVLGICVGLQILYEGSDEEPGTPGLAVLPGWVRRIPATAPDGGRLTVPHMGWNTVRARRDDPLLAGVDGQRAYYVHSFYADPSDHDHVLATTGYGVDLPAIAREGAVVGTQFHPEKSGEVGRRLLENLRVEVAAHAEAAAAGG